jgi:hypothetical protein
LQPWFFEWKFGLEDWNSLYVEMAPDDLHSVYGGVLGSHLLHILDEIGRLLPIGVTAFNQVMDVRLHRCYTHHKPGDMWLPSSPNFFSSRYPTPNYEWKAILQVLPMLVAGLFKVGGRDVLVEWAVALADWVEATFYPPDGVHSDSTLSRSDELLFDFELKSDAIGGLQSSRWNIRKFHELAIFSSRVRMFGSHKWYSTERGERQHHWVKIWWDSMNGRDIEKGLFKQ